MCFKRVIISDRVVLRRQNCNRDDWGLWVEGRGQGMPLGGGHVKAKPLEGSQASTWGFVIPRTFLL